MNRLHICVYDDEDFQLRSFFNIFEQVLNLNYEAWWNAVEQYDYLNMLALRVVEKEARWNRWLVVKQYDSRWVVVKQ